jgi:protocatechuate 3,4-dioxygenase, alpha subunit
MSGITTSQTIGPFFHDGLKWAFSNATNGVTITGRVFDGNGAPVTDAMIEAWRPDVALGDTGFVRVATNAEGRFTFTMPSAPAVANEPLAYVCLFARGLLNHHFSAVFVDAGSSSALIAQVPEARRATLIANRVTDASYEWDIHLQGERETVFFEYQ